MTNPKLLLQGITNPFSVGTYSEFSLRIFDTFSNTLAASNAGLEFSDFEPGSIFDFKVELQGSAKVGVVTGIKVEFAP